ncbi:AAA family ATPase [Amycolatopsis sp. NPDC021455]|uniref:AAA family ATPase n=1 Tax=Amycolatopsis sp. NPDC021455 TaxID=3154901 RepID=UPI0033F134AD
MYQTPPGSREVPTELVDRWLVRACESLMSTWDDASGNFWRDSWCEDGDSSDHETQSPEALGRGKGATSNNRSFQALVAAAYFFSENDLVAHSSLVAQKIRTAVWRMISDYFSLDLDLLRGHGENRENPFTDAQLLLSLSLALSPVTSSTCRFELPDSLRGKLVGYLVELTDAVGGKLSEEGVKVHESARTHHFLTLHSIRALDAAARTLAHVGTGAAHGRDGTFPQAQLLNRVRDEIVQQLGLHLLPAPGFDSSSLVSCCALLARFTGDADSPLIEQGVAALVKDQSQRGTWTSAGVLSFGGRRLVYIPSVELSLALSTVTLLDLQESDLGIYTAALPAMDASFRLVQSSFAKHEHATGWRNDRTRAGYEIESWTTAVVLQFLLAYREALRLARQERILRKYRAARSAPEFRSFWADLTWLVPHQTRYQVLRDRQLPESRLERFASLVDPTQDNGIVTGIRSEILEPTLHNVNERPVETASFLLYGPPGTRKTSLVVAMARELDWPLLTLSPPVFLRNGIEGFEAAADEIFEDLMHLRRAVVLFDECEEFFKWRPSATTIESRTVGAFITSGMLPRLQRLRENRWIVFVINSNAEKFELDDAVTRRGRLDKAARIGHPVLEAQLRYLKAWRSRSTGRSLDAKHIGWFTQHLTKVEEEMRPHREDLERQIVELQREHPGRDDEYRHKMAEMDQRSAQKLTKVVTFGSLDTLAERCLGEGLRSGITSSKTLRENLQQEFERSGPDSFTPPGRTKS